MSGNSNLRNAQVAKNDEFYTQYDDIQKEVNCYVDYNPDVFRGKTILLPCDDPEWSNFTRFFAQNFERFGLKKLISTSFAVESKIYKDYEPTLFETESLLFDMDKTRIKGKIFVLDKDTNHSGHIDIHDLTWNYLEGDGDFRSDEVKALRDEADVIVTNPPFSIIKEFISWIIDSGKEFLIIGNTNVITYKDVFPHIKNNEIWLGNHSGHTLFEVPEGSSIPDFYDKADTKRLKSNGYIVDKNGKLWRNLGNICWFTNIDHGRRHRPLELLTMADNFKFSKHVEVRGREYAHYENYDAIEVPFYDAIPSDYDGIMGVPISYLDKYCPEQFQILGMCENEDLYGLRTRKFTSEECRAAYYAKFQKKGTYDLNASGVIVVNGRFEKVYQRVLIRKVQS